MGSLNDPKIIEIVGTCNEQIAYFKVSKHIRIVEKV